MADNDFPATKKCGDCGRRKNRAKFYANSTAADGLQSICKDCSKERRRQNYQDNLERERRARRVAHAADPERQHAANRRYYERTKGG